MTFKQISKQKTIKDIIIEEYKHLETGARHTHVNIKGGENAFNITV